jgi:hypothetical protein
MIYYILITIALAAVDAWRIKRAWAKVQNINHWLSYVLAAVGIAGLYFIVRPDGWHIATFIIGCIAIRGMLYDGCLNIFRREKLVYQSTASNSLNDSRLAKISFWWRRAGYTFILLVVIIVNHFI